MPQVGYEVHRIKDLPDHIRVKFKKQDGYVVKKIFNPKFRVEWEELESKPSEWLMKALPSSEVE